MAIQWYPGHMHKAQKEIRQLMPVVDLVIEVLDARIPFSSANPLVKTLREGKPCIKVLSKMDLADPKITQQWQQTLEKDTNVRAIPMVCSDKGQVKQLLDLARSLFPHRDKAYETITMLIMGIPNVGKSTLINTLVGKQVAKTGNEPAVTKGQQKIDLGNGIILFDSPGILWPKVENEKSTLRLAASGAIRDTAMEYDEVAHFTAHYLMQAYPELLCERYQLDTLPLREAELLQHIGELRGCLRAGGTVDRHKVATLLIRELRQALIGRISLESPDMIGPELAHVETQKQLKEEQAAERRASYMKGKRPNSSSSTEQDNAEPATVKTPTRKPKPGPNVKPKAKPKAKPKPKPKTKPLVMPRKPKPKS